MTVTKASTCCAKDGAECACGIKQPAPAASNPPSTATAPRLLQKTPSLAHDALAELDPLASVPVTALRQKTLLFPDRPARVAQDLPAADGGFNPALEVDFTTRK
ncbi:hypothetical protein E4U23_002338 [Claviceps purpurea]|nr:hypothetical protein E4U28_003154 [Claviceps purpurea]KAG6165461.1 hypothetical protein E4U51_004337 [Claviceps purpurea]KAG6209879.1 hypothetical protein E4U50_002820 [Claviceps purpurea]KAG6232080.1 hypothetical protein E4U26_005954 [Claviceps purpurea]KAG6257669.1 hypothetical protein E4U23_002338 [Claviceps purpurea]